MSNENESVTASSATTSEKAVTTSEKGERASENPSPNNPTKPLPISTRDDDVVVPRSDRRSRIWAVAFLVVIALVGLGTVRACSWLKSDDKPFAQSTVDRSGPVVLKSIQDLARFQAATGTFQVVVDLEKDTKYVPSAILGQRTLFVGIGTVDAYVDFSGLTSKALTISEDRRSVALKLPPPGLEKVNLDTEKSYVFAEKRGVIDRFKGLFTDDPNHLKDIYIAAERKITDAAKDAGLAGRAQTNTRAMLIGMFHSLGFTTVTVTFSST